MTRYPGTDLFRSKRRYMIAMRDLYPAPVSRNAIRVARALRMAGVK